MHQSGRASLSQELERSERKRCCLHPNSPSQESLASIMVRHNELMHVSRALYARPSTWSSLDAAEQMRWRLRSLCKLHERWTFCGPTAAVAYGLPVSSNELARLSVVLPRCDQRDTTDMCWHEMSNAKSVVIDGMRVTPLEKTVADCLRWMEFRHALAIADAAMRSAGHNQDWLMDIIEPHVYRQRGAMHAREVARHADPLAESGGESIARGSMIELGFMMPTLQAKIDNPIDGGSFRVDFLWQLEQGIVVGELDGRQKYSDPVMTQGRSAVEILSNERLRESRLTRFAQVIRFSYRDVLDRQRCAKLLDAYGIPRVSKPHIIDLRPRH